MTQSATRRTIDILELLVEHPGGLPHREICSALSIPKSIAHRLLALLAERGFVQQDAGTGNYRMTLKLSLMGARHLAGTGVSDISQPILDRLASATGELARLAVVENDGMVWVAKAQGARHGLRYDPDAGMHVVLHATATGKAWLATLPEATAMCIVKATRFTTPDHFGPKVIRAADRFRAELSRTKARGFGLAIDEGEPGTAALAVAVFASGAAGAPAVGTLSVAGPVSRFSEQRRKDLVALLHAAASELSTLWPMRRALAGGLDARAANMPSRSIGEVRHAV